MYNPFVSNAFTDDVFNWTLSGPTFEYPSVAYFDQYGDPVDNINASTWQGLSFQNDRSILLPQSLRYEFSVADDSIDNSIAKTYVAMRIRLTNAIRHQEDTDYQLFAITQFVGDELFTSPGPWTVRAMSCNKVRSSFSVRNFQFEPNGSVSNTGLLEYQIPVRYFDDWISIGASPLHVFMFSLTQLRTLLTDPLPPASILNPNPPPQASGSRSTVPSTTCTFISWGKIAPGVSELTAPRLSRTRASAHPGIWP